jgi:hypothetical protein
MEIYCGPFVDRVNIHEALSGTVSGIIGSRADGGLAINGSRHF